MDKRLFVFMKHGDALDTCTLGALEETRVGMSGQGMDRKK